MIALILTLCVAGFVAYLINQYVPMQAIFKTIINFVIAIFCIFAVCNAFGWISGGPFGSTTVPHVHVRQ